MRLLPKSFVGQLTLLLFLALLIAQAVAFALFSGERMRASRQVYQDTVVQRAVTLRRLLRDTPPDLHARVLQVVSDPRVRFTESAAPTTTGDDTGVSQFLASELAAALDLPDDAVRVSVGIEGGADGEAWWTIWRGPARHRPPKISWFRASIEIGGGSWMNIETAPPPDPRPFRRTLFISLILSSVATLAVAVLVARRIVRPMRALAKAADSLGRGETVGPVPETGPDEARRSVHAFNEMRERLDRFVRDRTQMLAAISHDLRTPITTLRLRAELLDDEDIRDRIIETIEEMQDMTEATLAFVRADQAEEETRPIDLAALVDSLGADLVELGLDIAVHEEARPIIRGRTVALRRAIRNIIENAVRYGERASVTVQERPPDNEARIIVDDNGPGLAPHDFERVFEPFVRGESSRSRETGGIGLGLAIARTIFRSHGGDITLENREKGGLRVIMTLPA